MKNHHEVPKIVRISNRKETEFLRVEGGSKKQMAPNEFSYGEESYRE